MTQANSAEQQANPTLKERVKSLSLGERADQPNPRTGYLPWVFVVVLVFACALLGYRAYRVAGVPTGETPQAEAPKKPSPGTQGPDPGPPSADAPSTEGAVVLQSKGYVVAAHQIQLSPQIGGEVIWIDPNFKEGAVYTKGDRLAEIDPVIATAQLKNMKAALQVAKVNREQAKSGTLPRELETAKAALEAMKAKLRIAQIDARNKRSAGSGVSRDELEKSDAQVAVDRANAAQQAAVVSKLEATLAEQRNITEAQVLSAEAAVEQAAKQLKNCTILAPTTGIILSKKAELGGYVNPLAFGAAGYLCEMADLTDLEVDLSVQERDIPLVFEGQKCEVMPEAYQNDRRFRKAHPRGYEGVVSRLMPMADRAKGAIPVRVKVLNIPKEEAKGMYLRPEMGALVSFKAGGELMRSGK